MTSQEKLQPRSTFIEAGRVACRLGINFIDNPYRDEPFKSAWEKGYELENRKAGQRMINQRRTRQTGNRGQ
jgi:hypothetical protein